MYVNSHIRPNPNHALMNRSFKFLASLSLCLIVILSFDVSTCFSGSSIEDLRKAAEQGGADAQYKLAVCYDMGIEVPENLAEAVNTTASLRP